MNSREQRATFGLATIFAFRMLGLFMVLPVFSLYAHQLKGSTPELIGIAIGIYGLTQAFLQIPFGTLSDYWGRKPVIAIGLGLFAVGSVVAALSHSIIGVIIGRALQGTGAVGSTIIAFVGDLTAEENRTKAMGLIGLIIGFSFTLAMVLGPLLNGWIHVSGIFWLSGLLAISAIVILYTLVPNADFVIFHSDSEAKPGQIFTVLKDFNLLRLNIGIFFQHAILTALFIALPIILSHSLAIPVNKQWLIYLPALVLSLFITVPFIIIAEKKRLLKPLFIGAVLIIFITQFNMAFLHHSLTELFISLVLFFSAFNFLEASLPSMISKLAPLNNKGTAMGLYSSSQFLGIFFGGILGGWLYGQFHITGVFIGCGIMAISWFLASLRMQKIPYFSTRIFKLSGSTEQVTNHLNKLKHIPGIVEISFNQHERAVYLKVDTAVINDEQIKKLLNL